MDLGDANLQAIRVLGSGTFGTVYLCRYLARQQLNVCVKRISIANLSELAVIKKEIYIISQLHHPNIVRFLRHFEHASTVNIVMEYAPNGTVQAAIQKNKALRPVIPKPKMQRYFCDILMGLEYLHIRHVIHRDLKPANLLIDASDHVKIADFGISGISNKQLLGKCGTYLYMPPEVMHNGRCVFKSDIWSLGVILYEMCNGFSPFCEARKVSEIKYLMSMLARNGVNSQAIARSYGEIWGYLCEQMLVYDLEKRISLPQIMRLDAEVTSNYYKKYFDYKY